MKKRRILPVVIAAVVVVMMMIIMICVLSVRVEATVPGGIISDGVYALKNKATGKYLDIQYDSPDVNMYIQQYAYGNAPSTDSTRSGLFKFSHRGSNGYIIRTMRNNGNSFYRVSDTAVKTCAVDPVDGNNATSANWYLSSAGSESEHNYYYIKAYGVQKFLCAPASGVNNNKYCTTESLSNAGDRAKWEFVPYNGTVIKGLTFKSHPSSVYMESSTQFNAYMWTTDMSNNGPITWGVHNSTIGSLPCSATITNTGILNTYAVYETVDVSISANVGTTLHCVVSVEPPIPSGLYAIKNNYSDMYMDIRGNSFRTKVEMQQFELDHLPSVEEEISLMYKVYWTGESNKYTIRNMTNNANGFKATNISPLSDVLTAPIGSETYWYITRKSENEYVIKSSTGLAIGVQDNEHSGSLGENAELSKLKMMYATSEKANWNFISLNIPNTIRKCVVLYNKPQIMEEGGSISLAYSNLGTYCFYTTDLSINEPGNPTGYSVNSMLGGNTEIAYTLGGYLYGNANKAGMVKVKVLFPSGWSEPFAIFVKPSNSFPTKYCFINNVQVTDGFIQSNSYSVIKSDFTYNETQIWRLIPAGVCQYYIQNMDGKYLTSPTSSSSGSIIYMESNLLSGTEGNRQIWRFEDAPSNSGKKRIQSLAMGNYWARLKMNLMLFQGEYTNDSDYSDEFDIVFMNGDVVFKRSHPDFNPVDTNTVKSFINNLYKYYDGFSLMYNDISFGNINDPNNPDSYNRLTMEFLSNSSITVISGHGAPDRITVSELPNEQQLFLYNIDVYSTSNPNVLSNVDIVIFAGCSTAGNIEPDYNITQSAGKAGAKVALGWTVTQYGNKTIEWTKRFFDNMNSIDPLSYSLYSANRAQLVTNNSFSSTNEVRHSKLYGTDTTFSFN